MSTTPEQEIAMRRTAANPCRRTPKMIFRAVSGIQGLTTACFFIILYTSDWTEARKPGIHKSNKPRQVPA